MSASLSRRDALERILYAISALLFALFGIRPDVEPEEWIRSVKATAGQLLLREIDDDVYEVRIAGDLMVYASEPCLRGIATWA